MDKSFRITFPIAKSEELSDGRMLVRGIATSDAIDKQGERLLFGGSVKAFQKWLDTGPAVREQHDPLKAVGSGLSFTPLPDEGAIAVEVFVSAAEVGTQTKLREKVLRSFSIGGTPLGKNLVKVGDKIIKEIPEWEMEELSLVDRPANPDCQITFSKAGSILATKEDQVAEKKKGKPPEGEEEEKPATGAVTPPAEEKPPAPGAAEGGKEPPAEEGEGKPAPAGEAGEEGQESGKDEPPAATPPAVEKPPLSDDDLGKIVASVTDAVLAAIKEQTEAVKGATTPEQKPAEKGAPAPEIRKDEEADVLSAAFILDSLKNLRVSEGAEPEIETKQLAALARCASALAEFIALEAGEVVMNAEAPMSETEGLTLSARIDGLEKAILNRLDGLGSMQKSAPLPDPRLDVLATIEPLSETVRELKAAVDGELKAIRKDMGKILSLPVPGHAPMKFAAAYRSTDEHSERGEAVRILENMLAKADTLSRPAIERELNMLHARNGS